MKINYEYEKAISLWEKYYEKEDIIKDFAGRKIKKQDYQKTDSEYGWVLDYILPLKEGGKENEENIILCHYITSKEKADNYSKFFSNDQVFKIVRRDNLFKIIEVELPDKNKVNFFRSNQGLNFINNFIKKDYFLASINIKLKDVSNNIVIDFINEVFSDYFITFKKDKNKLNTYYINIKIKISQKDIIDKILDKCVLLNTYFSYYFIIKDFLNSYDIIYNLYKLNDLFEYSNFKEEKVTFRLDNTIHINNLVVKNSKEFEKDKYLESNIYVYDTYYTELARDLLKNL